MPETKANRVALITGGGSGIGRATAMALARQGFALALVGRRMERLEETRRMLPPGTTPLLISADIADPGIARSMIDRAVARFGRLDALINNAGDAPRVPIERTLPELLDRVYKINALAPANAIARVWPIFKAQSAAAAGEKRDPDAPPPVGGRIVSVSTLGTIDPFPGFFAYASAKASVNLMARCCANEGRAHGIFAFAVAPGAVETEMLRVNFPEGVLAREKCLSVDQVAAVIVECVLGERDAQSGDTILLPSPE